MPSDTGLPGSDPAEGETKNEEFGLAGRLSAQCSACFTAISREIIPFLHLLSNAFLLIKSANCTIFIKAKS